MLSVRLHIMQHIFISQNELETINLASFLARHAFSGQVIALDGPLGSGKTTFVKGFAQGLKIKDRVISPTFNILKCYFHEPLSLYHIDAYRLEDEFIELGLEEYIEGEGVTLIEWPNFINKLIPQNHLLIQIKILTEESREFTFIASDEKNLTLIYKLKGYQNV